MDKFAVDIEKVLDEFEYNEGREESVTPVVIKNHSLSHLPQKQIRPPAASYRRPAFEPINLADADFAAAPITPSPNYSSVKQNNLKPKVTKSSESVEPEITSPPLEISNENNIIRITNDLSNKNNLKESNLITDITETNFEVVQSDDTPDLLDAKTLIPVQSDSDREDENLECSKQLPDITSVRSAPPSNEIPETQPVFDLIKPSIPIPVGNDTEELPPLVSVNHLIKEELPELQVQQVSFDAPDDISETEVEEYLNNLEVDESLEVDENVKQEDNIDQSIEESEEPVTLEEPTFSLPEDPASDSDSAPEFSNSDMGLTSSSTKEEIDKPASNDTRQMQPSDFNKFSSEKSAVLQDFQSGSSDNRKCELGNIDSRPCTTHSDIDVGAFASIDSPSSSKLENSINNKLNEESGSKGDNAEKPAEVGDGDKDREGKESQLGDLATPSPSDGDQSIEESVRCLSPDDGEASEDKPPRPSTLPLADGSLPPGHPTPPPGHTPPALHTTMPLHSPPPQNSLGQGLNSPMETLGKLPPLWVPDTEADNCMQCQTKFTVIKRRHHCRACGLVLCSKCCNLKAPLEFMMFMEARVCQPCFNIIYRVNLDDDRYSATRQPNPNNPMEYCSTIPPHQQASFSANQPPPSVLVPTSVLKREGRSKSDVPKQVIFSDGIRPGGDLTELDPPSESRIIPRKSGRRLATTPTGAKASAKLVRRPLDPNTHSFIPSEGDLPPPGTVENGEFMFLEDVTQVTDVPVKFAINYNLFVNVKKVKLDCCVHRECWSAASEGLAFVGQDEVAIVLEALPNETTPPKDIFHLINTLHLEASKGTTVTDMCFTPTFSSELLGSKDHGGFIYIRPTFQCTTNLILPTQPYLIAILVHRWETPWARLFPLRLVLRLGAEYRYYPCPLVSIRNRSPLYTDIGHTVMKILVDFRKYSYSLATVRGLVIHMEDRQTTILFPRNRYDQVVRALNNSNDSVLAFGANLSLIADSHLVCIQGTKDENTYHTQAINIHNKPRRVTGASFVVFNGALKTAGLSGKSSIMEDGLMVQLPSDSMTALRTALREMRDYTVSCGPNDEETVLLQWTNDDTNFNIGVKSCIDGKALDGVPSIRVHNGTDYPGNSKIIRWTEVFILQTDEGGRATDPIDISRVSELLARATCIALVPELDSLAKANYTTIAIRANIHPDNVSYEAGSLGEKLPSAYMRRLDEELVPVVHQAAISSQDSPAILELVFRIMIHF